MPIKQGNSTALVGQSGSGKSTIFSLLLRFYDVQRGQILIDGIDIKTIDLAHLRALYGIVRQEPLLFNGTIKYNIVYDQEYDMRRIEEASREAMAYSFIQQHEEKFERDVGNRGEKLSGGQKQRICIARCLVRRPKMYLFDEATSALDSKSEEEVQKAIEKVSQSATTVTIAHWISTIKDSDEIFVFDDGKILENGNFQQLMQLNGIFADLAKN